MCASQGGLGLSGKTDWRTGNEVAGFDINEMDRKARSVRGGVAARARVQAVFLLECSGDQCCAGCASAVPVVLAGCAIAVP